MVESTHVHQCPYCELLFEYHQEVKDHILHDHPQHAAFVDGIEPRELPHRLMPAWVRGLGRCAGFGHVDGPWPRAAPASMIGA